MKDKNPKIINDLINENNILKKLVLSLKNERDEIIEKLLKKESEKQ